MFITKNVEINIAMCSNYRKSCFILLLRCSISKLMIKINKKLCILHMSNLKFNEDLLLKHIPPP